jgi:GTPase SAR1 family protein
MTTIHSSQLHSPNGSQFSFIGTDYSSTLYEGDENMTQLLEAERLARQLFEESPWKPNFTMPPSSEANLSSPLNWPLNPVPNATASNLTNVEEAKSDNINHRIANREQQQQGISGTEDLRKRRRKELLDDDEETWHQTVVHKLEKERKKIDTEESLHNRTTLELYVLFNNLQAVSADLNIAFQTPEFVVVGMQSDGKSSFIEGLLGFQFNIVDTNIGTRRPLIIQMVNCPDRDQPRCRFRKEHAISHNEDPFETVDIPVNCLCDEIIRRTNAKAGVDKDQVTDIPIILRVEYKYCANLTIYDTPGFRLGGDEALRKNIEEMVIRIIKPKHRLIICLEQSTVEWANTISRPLVRQVDPDFSRTILVNTKFDNRVKEFRDAESTNKYLQGENLPSGKKPFFISMPVRRNLDPRHFADAMKECYLTDYRQLLNVRFDEKRFGSQIGIFNLKIYLEKLLQKKYIESIVPTFQILDNLCISTQNELVAIERGKIAFVLCRQLLN